MGRLRRENSPSWLKKRLVVNEALFNTEEILSHAGVSTVCVSSMCPNLNECFSRSQATFLILGDVCTRSCGFCSVKKGTPAKVDADEPARIAEAIRKLGLSYVVITSVTRDDLDDGGAGHFTRVMEKVREVNPQIEIELLVPDFEGQPDCVVGIVRHAPEVFGHNIETVGRLYPIARRGAGYQRSLGVLRKAKEISAGQITKSGLMLGLGEEKEEVVEAMKDLRDSGCDIITIGQYLRPAPLSLSVKRYVDPGEFAEYEIIAREMGFRFIASGPYVRSSYLAQKAYETIKGVSNDRCYTAADR